MTALVIAEHDNAHIKAATLNTVTAAGKLGGDVHVLVAGAGCSAADHHHLVRKRVQDDAHLAPGDRVAAEDRAEEHDDADDLEHGKRAPASG